MVALTLKLTGQIAGNVTGVVQTRCFPIPSSGAERDETISIWIWLVRLIFAQTG